MSAITICNRTRPATVVQDVSFGVYDPKGREYGARVYHQPLTFAFGPPVHGHWGGKMRPMGASDNPPGAFCSVRVQATRGGKDFGSTQPGQIFPEHSTLAMRLYERDRVSGTRARAESRGTKKEAV